MKRSNARIGRDREHDITHHLQTHGWTLIGRSAGSKGPADLAMAHPTHGLALIQVGGPNKTLGPTDRRKLIALADLCGALPILAQRIPRQPIRYYHITPGTASSWHQWTP